MNKDLQKTKENIKVKGSIHHTKIDQNVLNNFDPKILDFVVILNHLGLTTFSSCQGHPKEGNMADFSPYFTFCNEYAETLNSNYIFNDSTNKLLEEYDNNLHMQQKLLNYLNEFYIDRKTPLRYRLNVSHAILLRTVLEPYFRILSEAITDQKEMEEYNSLFLKEVDDFTEFLKTKI
jgi:hypothetical protein